MAKAKDSEAATTSIPFAVAVQQLEKEFGHGIVMSAANSPVLRIHRIPTAIFPLDWSLAGGFPAGRVTLIWGRKSAGKTTTILKLISQYQKMCSRCFEYNPACICNDEAKHLYVHWNDVEGTFDPVWAKTCGVDLDGVQVSRPAFAEQAIDVFQTMAHCSDVGLVVMDSVAQLVPMKEVEKSAAEYQQALGARMVNKFVRVIVGAQQAAAREGRTLTIILINQARSLIASYGPAGEIVPYGLQQQFGASVVLRMMHGKPEFKDDSEKKKDPETGKKPEKEYIARPNSVEIKFVVQRSKVSAPGVEGEFNMMLKPDADRNLAVTDADDLKVTVAQGQRLGYIRKEEIQGGSPSWVAGPVKGRTLDEVKQQLMADRAMLAVVKRGIVEMEYRAATM